MTAKQKEEDTLLAPMVGKWEEVGRKVAELAGELPAEMYGYRPVESIRTISEVLRHVAFWNRYVAASLKGEPFDDALNEVPAAEYATKPAIVAVLEQSSQDVVAALRNRSTAIDPKTVELITAFVEHNGEHYGQLAVYCRLLGIVPAASRS